MDNKSIFLPVIDNGFGMVRMNYFFSFLNAFEGMKIRAHPFSDSLPPRARNRAAAYFLKETTEDYMLFIDADILFTKDQIQLLSESDAPVIGGIYCKKSKGIEPCLNTLPGHVETECGGYQEIARQGTGFLRIHRSVLEKMKDVGADNPHWAKHYTNHGGDEWEFFPVGVVNHEYLSEDWYFCDMARGLGFKIILDTRIQLRHEGSAIFPLEEVIEKLNAAGGRATVEPMNDLAGLTPPI